jgi:hypothetical protein
MGIFVKKNIHISHARYCDSSHFMIYGGSDVS